MNEYDVVIVGGGVIGTSICRELCRYKLKVALLEKEEELAFGVSKSNSGIIHPRGEPKFVRIPNLHLEITPCVNTDLFARDNT